MTLHIDRVNWHPQHAIEAADRAGKDGAERGGQHLLEAANARVPFDTGELESSGSVRRDGELAVIGYEAAQGVFVHAHPEWHFQNGRSGRWLEEAIDEEGAAVGSLLGDSVRAGWPG